MRKFADSAINAFDPSNGTFLGTIPVNVGASTPGGPLDLTFGNGAAGGDPNTLYFSAGISGERDGLLAVVSAIPEPSTLAVLAAALMICGGCSLVRSRTG